MSTEYVGRIRRAGAKAWRNVEGTFNGPEAALAQAGYGDTTASAPLRAALSRIKGE